MAASSNRTPAPASPGCNMRPTGKFHDAKCLEGADGAMQALVAEPKNPYYECLLPFGAYTAARLNAEQGRNYDVAKLVNWCFAGQTPARGGDWARSSVVGASMTFRA